jgi:hypothetical protein
VRRGVRLLSVIIHHIALACYFVGPPPTAADSITHQTLPRQPTERTLLDQTNGLPCDGLIIMPPVCVCLCVGWMGARRVSTYPKQIWPSIEVEVFDLLTCCRVSRLLVFLFWAGRKRRGRTKKPKPRGRGACAAWSVRHASTPQPFDRCRRPIRSIDVVCE